MKLDLQVNLKINRLLFLNIINSKVIQNMALYIHIIQVRTTICMMSERKGAPQVLDYLIPPNAKKHALS